MTTTAKRVGDTWVRCPLRPDQRT